MTNNKADDRFEHRGADIIELKIEKLIRKAEWEYCVLCGQRTGTRRAEPVQKRLFYIEGVGQLCPSCYRETND